MNRKVWMIALLMVSVSSMAQDAVKLSQTDTTAVSVTMPEIPIWKQKLYYGYNFDIYYHHDSRSTSKENGWSIRVEPEIGWRVKEKIQLGMRLGGCYQHSYLNYEMQIDGGETKKGTLRVMQGSWSATPFVRYQLKTLFDGKLGIWLEAHLYTGMDFPTVTSGESKGTEYHGLKYCVSYGAQVSPLITYQFNRKSTFQIYFSILSLGYSGMAYMYTEKENNRFTNDVIIFSGKLRNLIANQLTPGLYGLKFGIQKSF